MRREFDVAISFAGEDRGLAQDLAKRLQAAGLLVFYDDDQQAELLGEHLLEYLIGVYKERASYCVVLISAAYVRKRWTRHEWRAAQERAFEQQEAAYILPVRLDDTALPGLLSTIGHISIPPKTVAEAARLIYKKVASRAMINRAIRSADVHFQSGDFQTVISTLQPHWEGGVLTDDGFAVRLLADAHMFIGAYEQALPILDGLIPSRPQDAESRFLAGICCYRLGRLPEAVLYYRGALQIAPGHRTAREDLERIEGVLRGNNGVNESADSRAAHQAG